MRKVVIFLFLTLICCFNGFASSYNQTSQKWQIKVDYEELDEWGEGKEKKILYYELPIIESKSLKDFGSRYSSHYYLVYDKGKWSILTELKTTINNNYNQSKKTYVDYIIPYYPSKNKVVEYFDSASDPNNHMYLIVKFKTESNKIYSYELKNQNTPLPNGVMKTIFSDNKLVKVIIEIYRSPYSVTTIDIFDTKERKTEIIKSEMVDKILSEINCSNFRELYYSLEQ